MKGRGSTFMCAIPYLDGLVTAVPYQRVHDKVSLQNGSWYFLLNERKTTLHFSEHLALDCTWKYFLFVKIMANSVASRNTCTGPKLNLGTTQSPACPALRSKMNGLPLQGGDTSDTSKHIYFVQMSLKSTERASGKWECATLPLLKGEKRSIFVKESDFN